VNPIWFGLYLSGFVIVLNQANSIGGKEVFPHTVPKAGPRSNIGNIS
jgi:hypothetical protein